MLVITNRVVFTEVSTTAFFTCRSTQSCAERNLEHLACAISIGKFRIGARLILDRNLIGLLQEIFEFAHGAFHIFAATENTNLACHDLLHTCANLGSVFVSSVQEETVKFGLNLSGRVINQRCGNVDTVFSLVAEVGDEFANNHTCNNGFSNRVAAQTVKAVHIPATGFASGKEAFQCTRLACVVRTHATHGVVHSRTNRNPFLRRINT